MIKLILSIPGLTAAIERLERIADRWQDWRRPTLAEARQIMHESVANAMRSGGYPGRTWAPRSEVSRKLRPDGGMQNLVTLLRDDVTQSTARLRLQFAAGVFLSEGGTTAAGSMIAGKRVPPRPLMMIDDAAARKIRERQRSAVSEGWR